MTAALDGSSCLAFNDPRWSPAATPYLTLNSLDVCHGSCPVSAKDHEPGEAFQPKQANIRLSWQEAALM